MFWLGMKFRSECEDFWGMKIRAKLFSHFKQVKPLSGRIKKLFISMPYEDNLNKCWISFSSLSKIPSGF